MAKNEVANVADTEKPAWLVELEGTGAAKQDDNFDASDVAIPQIKLLQGTSQQLQDFDDAKAGEFWHTGMDISLGKDIKFIVCSRRKKYLLQAPLDDSQGVLARANDAKTWDRTGEWNVRIDKKTTATWKIEDTDVEASGLTNWGTSDPEDENSPPAATLFYEYLVLIDGRTDLGPAVISLARSAIKKAKKGLNDKISLHLGNGRPMQACMFSAGVTVEQNDSNQDFNNWKFTGAGFVQDEATYKHAVEIGEMLSDYKVEEEGVMDAPKKADSGGDF